MARFNQGITKESTKFINFNTNIMCTCRDEESTKLILQRVHSLSPKRIKQYRAIPRRRAVCLSARISTSFSLLIVIALSCIAGSELEQTTQTRALVGRHNAISPLSFSLQQLFGGLYRQRFAGPKPLLTDNQVDAYIRDGFVVISGLLDNAEVNSLSDAGEDVVSKHIEKTEGKFSKGNFQVHEFGLALKDKRFRDVALRSSLPQAAAELMQLDSRTQNLRVLRDAFLAKGHESSSSCGWHVDDQLFWPASYQLPTSTVDQSGINAWIALDDMPIEDGGSMAVSPGSHAVDFAWRSEALSALNFNDKFGNGIPKDDLFEMIKSGKVDSCGLEKFAPHVYDDIELSKQEFSFKKGDIIFMNRWLFHKSTDMTEKGQLARKALENSLGDEQAGDALLKRYSLRFATGTTSLPEGFMTEMSVLASDGLNLGKELNDVKGEWYPRAWPEVDSDVDEKLDTLVRDELPVGQEKLGALMAEVMALFQSR